MVKKIWSNNGNWENDLVMILTFLTIIVSGALSSLQLSATLVCVLFSPIPVSLLYMKVDRKKFTMIIVFMMLINMIVNGIDGAIGSLLFSVVLGIILATCIDKKYSSVNTVKFFTIACFFVLVINTVIHISINNIDINAILQQVANSYISRINEMIKMYKSIGVDENYISFFNQVKDMIDPKLIASIIPYLLTMYSLFVSTITYFLFKNILSSSNVEVPKKIGFRSFYISNIFIAILIGITSIGFILTSIGISLGDIIKNSGINIIYIILIINGMASVTYFFRVRANKSRVFIVIMLFIFLNLGLQEILLCIGFAEMLLDFRRMDPYSFRKTRKGV